MTVEVGVMVNITRGCLEVRHAVPAGEPQGGSGCGSGRGWE